MCGIAGRFNHRSGAPVPAETISAMCRLIGHRGPDGQGAFIGDGIGLGHRRLAVIDLSDAGRQPMSSADGTLWITFNGEIYNFSDIRDDLAARGHRFTSRTDTEVILAAYREYGTDCVNHLQGMFAFAIWNACDRSLFLARDRTGKKPLFYRLDRDGIAFASEPKAFLAEAGFVPEPDLRSIAHYISLQYVPGPYSAFQGVERLRPGSWLFVRNGQITTHRYWQLRYDPKIPIDEATATSRLLDLIRSAVKRRMVSDVPLGAFLSGGVDSSVVVAIMAQLSSTPVKTFSIGFDDKRFDELHYARAVAERYQTEHHEFIVRPQASAIFDDLVWHYNEPFADSSAIPTWYLAQMTRQHVTVALNGDGGDENFAGYARYRVRETAVPLPDRVLRALAAVGKRLPVTGNSRSATARAKRWLRRGPMTSAERHADAQLYFDPDLRWAIASDAFRPVVNDADSAGVLLANAIGTRPECELDQMLNLDVASYLPDALLVKVDIATMAHGLESRSPLLDAEVMEFAARLPDNLKLRDGSSKHVLKQVARMLLPSALIDRPKQGFSVPLASWFRSELKELAYDTLLSRTAAQRPYFRPAGVRRLLDEHVSGRQDHHERLWIMLMLESWHRQFIDGNPAWQQRGEATRLPSLIASSDHRSPTTGIRLEGPVPC